MPCVQSMWTERVGVRYLVVSKSSVCYSKVDLWSCVVDINP